MRAGGKPTCRNLSLDRKTIIDNICGEPGGDPALPPAPKNMKNPLHLLSRGLLLGTAAFVTINATFATGWTQCGPGCGGQVVSLNVDPTNNNYLYLGSDVAGVWAIRSPQSSTDSNSNPVIDYKYLTPGMNTRFVQQVVTSPTTGAADSTRQLFFTALDGVYVGTYDPAHPPTSNIWSRVGQSVLPSTWATYPYFSGLSVVYASGTWYVYAGIGYGRDGSAGQGTVWRYVGDNLAGTGSNCHWTALALPAPATGTNNVKDSAVYSVVADPTNPDNVWVTTDAGVFYSANATSNSVTWTQRNDHLPTTGSNAASDSGVFCFTRKLVVNPANFQDARVVVSGFNATAEVDGPCGQVITEGSADDMHSQQGGVYRWDGANGWVSLNGSLDLTDANGKYVAYNALAVDPTTSTYGDRLYVGSNTAGRTCYLTQNGNNASPTWATRLDTIAGHGETGWNQNLLGTNPNSLACVGSYVWAGKSGAIYRCENPTSDSSYDWIEKSSYSVTKSGFGTTPFWTNRGFVNTVVRSVAVHPLHANWIFMTLADRGLWASFDSGATWAHVDLQIESHAIQDAFFVSFFPSPATTGQYDVYVGAALGFGSSAGNGSLFRLAYGPGQNTSAAAVLVDATRYQVFGGYLDSTHKAVNQLDGVLSQPVDLLNHPTGLLMLAMDATNHDCGERGGVYQYDGTQWSKLWGTSSTDGTIVPTTLQIDPQHVATNDWRIYVGTRVVNDTAGVWAVKWDGTAIAAAHKLSGPAAPGTAINVQTIQIHASHPGWVLAASNQGIYRSKNSGVTWESTPVVPPTSKPAKYTNRGSPALAKGTGTYAAKMWSFVDGYIADLPVVATGVDDLDFADWDRRNYWSATSGVAVSAPSTCAAGFLTYDESNDRLYAGTSGGGLWYYQF